MTKETGINGYRMQAARLLRKLRLKKVSKAEQMHKAKASRDLSTHQYRAGEVAILSEVIAELEELTGERPAPETKPIESCKHEDWKWQDHLSGARSKMCNSCGSLF